MLRVQFKRVGPNRREWIWKARDASNTISISGLRFDTLDDAMRDARVQLEGLARDPARDDGPFAA